MSSNLQKLITSVRNQLAKLKPSNGLDAETLEALDDTANQVATLRAKLDYLLEVEAADLERKQAAEAAAKLKKHNTVLQNVAKQAEAAAANYQALTDRATKLIGELVAVLAEREQAFTRKTVGIESSEVHEYLTAEEIRELLNSLEYSVVSVSPGTFGGTWRESVAKTCSNDQRLHERLSGLVVRSNHLHDSHLSSPSKDLANKAHQLAEAEPVEVIETPRPTVAPAGQYQTVDLRG